MGFFAELRALVELRRQRLALERIASALESMLLAQDAGAEKRSTGLRSFYRAKGGEDGGVEMPSDDYFAEIEAEEMERVKRGGVEGGGDDDE